MGMAVEEWLGWYCSVAFCLVRMSWCEVDERSNAREDVVD